MNAFNPAYINIIAAVITKALPEGYQCKWHLLNYDRTVEFAITDAPEFPPDLGAPVPEDVWGYSVSFGWVDRTESFEGRQGPAFNKDNIIAFIDIVLREIKNRPPK